MRRAARLAWLWAKSLGRVFAFGACLCGACVAALVAGGLMDAGFVAATLTCYATSLACLGGAAWSLVGGE